MLKRMFDPIESSVVWARTIIEAVESADVGGSDIPSAAYAACNLLQLILEL